jgi:DNA transformation protein and related proteins
MNTGFKKVPNIGKELNDLLLLAEIENIEKLQFLGTEQAFIKLKTVHPEACINMLYAIEGAVQNIRWHYLETTRKLELKEFFRMLQE